METKNTFWKIFNKESRIEGHISKGFDQSIFNSYCWDLHLKNQGWKSYIWKNNSNNNDESYVKTYIKFYPFKIGIVWIPGGIIGKTENINTLKKSICTELNIQHCYLRVRCNIEDGIKEEINFLKNKWKKPIINLNSHYTMLLDIEADLDVIYSQFSRNWKRSIRKSIINKISYKKINNPNEIAKVYKQMREIKSLKHNEVFTKELIKSIINSFKENIIIFGAFNSHKKLLAIRGAIIYGEKALDIFAASTKEGKSLAVSNGLFLKLIEECKKNNCNLYDLNGIDPEKNMGVFLFKKGTGARIVKTIGEYESSTNHFLSLLINLFILIKKNI